MLARSPSLVNKRIPVVSLSKRPTVNNLIFVLIFGPGDRALAFYIELFTVGPGDKPRLLDTI